jgi:hypothetical protein
MPFDQIAEGKSHKTDDLIAKLDATIANDCMVVRNRA